MLFHFVTLTIMCYTIHGVQTIRNIPSYDNSKENYARLLSAIEVEDKSRNQEPEVEFSTSESKIHARRVPNPSSLYRNNGHSKANTSTKRFAHYSKGSLLDSQSSPSYTVKGDTYAPAESYQHDDYGWNKHSTHHGQHHHHHSHHHDDSHKGNSHLEYALIGLSTLAFGSFLLNGLLNLLTLGAGYFFTTTSTGGGGTGTATSTGTGGGIITSTSTSTTSTGGGGISSIGGIRGGIGLSILDDLNGEGISSSGLGDGVLVSGSPAANFALNVKALTKKKRPRRATIVLDVDPFTSFETMSEFVLNSIEAIKHNHECLPYVLCMGNKRAQIIKKGFQYYIPFYSLYAVYMSKDVGLRNTIPEHIRAILRGLSEANCRSDFQQC